MVSFTKEVNPRLGKRPLVFNGLLTYRRLTSLVKEATGILTVNQFWYWRGLCVQQATCCYLHQNYTREHTVLGECCIIFILTRPVGGDKLNSPRPNDNENSILKKYLYRILFNGMPFAHVYQWLGEWVWCCLHVCVTFLCKWMMNPFSDGYVRRYAMVS